MHERAISVTEYALTAEQELLLQPPTKGMEIIITIAVHK
jgi:hypothetical protein